jgi:hypothetical protein
MMPMKKRRRRRRIYGEGVELIMSQLATGHNGDQRLHM